MDKRSKLHRQSATAEDYARIALKPILNLEEAALYLNVCPKTVRRHTQSGTIPSFRLGRHLMYSKAALAEMVAKRTTGGAAK